MVLDKYDEKTYMHPFWQGDTVYHDGVLFYRGRRSARLLYPIDEIISVRSFDLQREFEEGKDFVVSNGEIVLTDEDYNKIYSSATILFCSNAFSQIFDYISEPKPQAPVVTEKVGRNDPCPCGSGKKFKNCCGK